MNTHAKSISIKPYVFWFVTGSQHLYGPETLQKVAEHAQSITKEWNQTITDAFPFVYKPVVKTPEEISSLMMEANADELCAGVITWMHTFSPAKMWIAGLTKLQKPILHLHTQYNRDIPWDSIDMDFMNMNQSAHGDREFGFIGARMGITRKIVVGHWQDSEVRSRVRSWLYTAVAVVESQHLKVARFGDNMRQVAVTEGDKVEAQIKFGWAINGYGIGDLVERMKLISDAEVNKLFELYTQLYEITPEGLKPGRVQDAIKEQARIEIGLRSILEELGCTAFTTTFEDLHGMKQLPGLAVQRLMADGYGFAGEGDWKTAALTRLLKIMAANRGTSFMEDYTYHFEPGNEMVLGSHMLEICPTISNHKPKIEVHPLGIGGKEDPARMVFDGQAGSALNASLIDLGTRFRLLVNVVEAVPVAKKMPKLPVARVLWKPLPSLKEAAEAWILAGGAHHTAYSYVVTAEQLSDWADMMGVECLFIDEKTTLRSFHQEIRWNDVAWKLNHK
jgi:L-arabinose isomerase